MTVPNLVTARGSRFEVGYQHGDQAKDLVRGTLDWSLQQLATGGVNPEEARVRAAKLLPHIESYAPELLEEVRGIAEGAGLDFIDAVVINTRYELLFLDGSRAPRPGVAGAECTLVGLGSSETDSGGPVIGQNVDLGADARELWLMLDLRPHGSPRLLTITMAGMLAQEGLNEAGLALCGSMVRSHGWGEGLPTRKFLRRKVLEQYSVSDAVRTIREAPRRASSHNLLLADAGTVVDVETTASDVRVLELSDGAITHTNHYLHPDFEQVNENLGGYLSNSTARHQRVRELIAAAPRPFGVNALKRVLADHGSAPNAICRHAEQDAWRGETNVAVIAQPAQRTLHVAMGPPCQNDFQSYSLPASDSSNSRRATTDNRVARTQGKVN